MVAQAKRRPGRFNRIISSRMRVATIDEIAWQMNDGDNMTLNSGLHQAEAARRGDKADGSASFHFAPTFKIDLVFSLIYVALFIRTWAYCDHTPLVCAIAGLFGFLLALCYAGKVAIIASLNQGGGDARTYVISSGLVTTGLYAYSRNPTYLLTLVQCVIWSAFLVFLQAFAPFEILVFALSLLLPVAFFLLHDLVIISREDAALSAAHPEAFTAYSQSVGRWFGRKRDARVD
jgi:protein-S-isoprenylcysteine O-methyltransferase Ste14